jgi:intracellular septation protein A
MTLSIILQGFLPLLVFAVVDSFAKARTALIAALFVAVCELSWEYYKFGEIEPISWISISLVVILGTISVWLDNSKFFKFQPVIVGCIFAGILIWFRLHDDPLLLKMLPKMVAMMPPEHRANLEGRTEFLNRLDLLLIPMFLVHAAIVAWAALKKGTWTWVIARGVGFYVLFILVMILNFNL